VKAGEFKIENVKTLLGISIDLWLVF